MALKEVTMALKEVRVHEVKKVLRLWLRGKGTRSSRSRSGQTITFAALTAKTLALSPITVSTTASSGLPVSFSTTTPSVCTSTGTNGGTITLAATGTCTVQASQAGNAFPPGNKSPLCAGHRSAERRGGLEPPRRPIKWRSQLPSARPGRTWVPSCWTA
jgi:hypothetical protein